MSFHSQLHNKLVTREEAATFAQALQAQGKKIVFTNGCFDLLHPGHVDYLSQARDLGDALVLGLNTDDSVRRLEKGANRPINSETARGLVLAALACIDKIVLFNEDTPLELIKAVQPDVLVKGSDYAPEKIVGYDIVTARGGKVTTIHFLDGYSTTTIIKKITG